jgi:hypothetical protein
MLLLKKVILLQISEKINFQRHIYVKISVNKKALKMNNSLLTLFVFYNVLFLCIRII